MNTTITQIGLIAVAALTLSACTTTRTETPVILSRTYLVSCTDALKAIQSVAAQISPGDTWLPYETVSAASGSLVLQASSRVSPTTRTSSVWNCDQTVNAFTANSAAITVSTTGLSQDVAQNVHRAFFSALLGR